MTSASVHAGSGHAASRVGEVLPREAWERLEREPDAILVDVRTPQEWALGEPDLAKLGKTLLKISWKLPVSFAVNSQFSAALRAAGADNKNAPVFFLCRSGGRSLDAAYTMAAEGYSHCYNVLNGFEGPHGASPTSSTVGWKASGLPWKAETQGGQA